MQEELFKEVAIKAAKEAGALLMDKFQKVSVSVKADTTLVTEADFAAEKIILGCLQSQFPEHGILSEEAGMVGSQEAEYLWVADPLDGTHNYVYGMTAFYVALCLLHNKQPILNVIYHPSANKLFVAEKGKGAFMNDEAIHVSQRSLDQAMVMTHLSSKKEARQRTTAVLGNVCDHVHSIRALGSSYASFTHLVNGRADCVFQHRIKPWDLLAAVVLIEEAGGKVTDMKGNPITFESDSVLATNGIIHNEMLKLLNP